MPANNNTWQHAHQTLKRLYLSTTGTYAREVRPAKQRLWALFLREVNSWSVWVDKPLPERVEQYRNGFLSKSAALYDFETYERSQYLSDLERQRTAEINEPQFSGYLTNKLGFYSAMEPFSQHRPEVYGVVESGVFHPVSSLEVTSPEGATETSIPGSSDRDISASDWILDRVKTGETLIVKPCNESGGKGVQSYSFRDGAYYVDGREMDTETLERKIQELSATLVMECVEQAQYADDLFPDSANTIRMITMWDEQKRESFCPVAVHRIGTPETAPTDNFGSGGISAQVDLETGELGEGVQFAESGVNRMSVHPSTGAQIEGTSIPGWTSIRDRMLNIAQEFSHVPYVGWDVVVTDPGEFVVIEANGCTDVDLLQAHGPLLTDDRTRRFYDTHGII